MKKIQSILLLLLLKQAAYAERFVLDKCIDLHEVIEYQEMPDTSLYVLGKSKHYATHAWDYIFDANGNVLDSTWIAVQPNTFLEYEVYHLNKYDKNDNLLWSFAVDTQYAYMDFYGFDPNEFAFTKLHLASFHIYDNKIYTSTYILPHFKSGNVKNGYTFDGGWILNASIINSVGDLITKQSIKDTLSFGWSDMDEIYTKVLYVGFEQKNPQPIISSYFDYSDSDDYLYLRKQNYYNFNSNNIITKVFEKAERTSARGQYLTEFINQKALYNNNDIFVIIKNFTDTIPLTYMGNTIPAIESFSDGYSISYIDTNYFFLCIYDTPENEYYIGNLETGVLQKTDRSNKKISLSVYIDNGSIYDNIYVVRQYVGTNHNKDIFNNYILQKVDNIWLLSKFNGQTFVPVDTLEFTPSDISQNGEYIYISYNSSSRYDSICIYFNDMVIYNGLLKYINEHGYISQLNPFDAINVYYYKPHSFHVVDNHIFSGDYYSMVYYSLLDDTYSLLNEGVDKFYFGEYLPLRKKFLLWNNPNFKSNIASCNAGFFHITDKEAIVKVRAYYDFNKNGIIDAGEKPLSSYKLQYPINGDDISTYIYDTNYYTVKIDTGLHHFTVSVPDTLFTVLVPTQSVYSQNYGSVDTLIYLIQPIKTVNDVAIKINRIGASRPGFNNSYTIQIENKGTTQVYISKLKLLYKPTLQLQPNISNYSFTKNGDSILINFNKYLLPQEKYYLQFNFKVATPPTVNIGDTIINSISIASGYSDDNASNNYALLQDILVGAYDPNDKQVDMPNYAIDDPMQVASQSLTYTIRFENKGNYYATHVFVHDTLPPGLDASTLQVLATSHPYTLSVINDSILEFQFWDIYLDYVDASNKGFITYSVATHSDIALLQEPIRNKASIVFDYNLPIVTDYAVTTIQIPTTNPKDNTSKATLSLYPNPNNGYFHIDLQNLDAITHAYIIDSKGSTIPVTLLGNAIEVQQLPAGIYQLVLQSKDTTWNVAFLKQ